MSFREFLFDLRLSGEQPIQCLVQFVFLRVFHAKFFGKGAVVPEPCGGQFGSRMQEPFDQHGQHQIAFSARLGTEKGLEFETAYGAQHSFDMTVWQGTEHMKGFGGGEEGFAGESAANDVDEGSREVGDVAEGFVADLIADAEGAAEEVGLVDPAFVLAGRCGYMNSANSRWHTFGLHANVAMPLAKSPPE